MAEQDWSEHDWSGPPRPGVREITYNPLTWQLPDWRAIPGAAWDVAKAPFQLTGSALEAVQHPIESAKALPGALARMAPAALGAAIGSPLGPGGMALGAAGGHGLELIRRQLSTGRPMDPTQATREMLGAGLMTGVGSRAPAVGEALKKSPGRYLSLPAERMAAGAEMMERIPGRFGVDDALVGSLYRQAETLSVRSMTQAPLLNFRQRLADMQAQMRMNPLTALQDKPLLNQITVSLNQLGARQNTMTPRQVDAVIKAVNHRIGSTEGATRGVWKQLLGGLHEDMKSAARTTGDPAFMAYERAIHTARLNFLKQDLEEVIRNAGIVQQRTGRSVITSPGKLIQWMQKNPDWQESIQKAQPGLLPAIRRDIQEIVPVTDIVGRTIPGQRYGSGRLVLGGAIGHLLSRLLGMPPGTAESMGAIFGGLSPSMGIKMAPGYIESSFKPLTRGPSRVGAMAGAAVAPATASDFQQVGP